MEFSAFGIRVSSQRAEIYVMIHISSSPAAINISDKYLILKQRQKSFSGAIYEKLKSFSGFPAYECNNESLSGHSIRIVSKAWILTAETARMELSNDGRAIVHFYYDIRTSFGLHLGSFCLCS